MERKTEDLLERLKQWCGCKLTSDLQTLSAFNRIGLAIYIDTIAEETYTPKQWNDVFVYLTGITSLSDKEEIKEQLIRNLIKVK